jgi:hypothetical protein
MDQVKKPLGAIPLWITRIAPFFLPAIFFQSAVFAFISPLPLFILSLKKRSSLSFVAFMTNLALLLIMGIRSEAIVIAVFWFAVGIFFPLVLRRSGKIQLSFLLSLFYMLTMLVVGLYELSHEAGMGMVEYARMQISIGMDHLITMPDSPLKPLVEEQGKEALYKQLMTELPSGIIMAFMLSLWINLLFASQLVKGFLSKKFWADYRNPEWLVWPTLACAGLFIWSDHALYYVGLNGMKVLLVLYGFQGLSVLAHVLNHYKIFGLIRVLLFGVAIFIAMPLVLSLGFFDLWFDFRPKLGQS